MEDDGDEQVKQITYFRHGESAGNAGLMGALERLSATAYRDGVLTKKGKKQVDDRVMLMDEDWLRRVVEPEVVLVSPLRRAMATAILLLGHAQHRLLQISEGLPLTSSCIPLPEDHRWPAVEVVAEMREKVKSDSEVPGSGDEKALTYVLRRIEKAGERLFCDKHAMDPVGDSILKSYVSEESRTKEWTLHRNGKMGQRSLPPPTDGVRMVEMIKAFKQFLATREEKNILMVGHSGWGRFAFAPFLPAGGDSLSQVDTLARGSREVTGLANVGAFSLLFDASSAMFRPDLGSSLPSSSETPNFDTETKGCLLYSMAEAIAAGVVPFDARESGLVLARFTQDNKERIFQLTSSTSLRVSFLSWFDNWGKLKGFTGIAGAGVSFTTDVQADEPLVLTITISSSSSIPPDPNVGEQTELQITFDSDEQALSFRHQIDGCHHS